MASGGSRPGAGRKTGGLVKRTKEIAEEVMSSGTTPLEIIIDAMNYYQALADKEAAKISGNELLPGNEETFKKVTSLKAQALSCAKDAAIYVHPKLNAISAPNGGPVQIGLTISFK